MGVPGRVGVGQGDADMVALSRRGEDEGLGLKVTDTVREVVRQDVMLYVPVMEGVAIPVVGRVVGLRLVVTEGVVMPVVGRVEGLSVVVTEGVVMPVVGRVVGVRVVEVDTVVDTLCPVARGMSAERRVRRRRAMQ